MNKTWGGHTILWSSELCFHILLTRTVCWILQRGCVCLSVCLCLCVFLSFHICCISSVNFFFFSFDHNTNLHLPAKIQTDWGWACWNSFAELRSFKHASWQALLSYHPQGFWLRGERNKFSYEKLTRHAWWMDGYVGMYFSVVQDGWYSPN